MRPEMKMKMMSGAGLGAQEHAGTLRSLEIVYPSAVPLWGNEVCDKTDRNPCISHTHTHTHTHIPTHVHIHIHVHITHAQYT